MSVVRYLGIVVVAGRPAVAVGRVVRGPLALLGRGGRRGGRAAPPRLTRPRTRARPARRAVYHLWRTVMLMRGYTQVRESDDMLCFCILSVMGVVECFVGFCARASTSL